MLWWKFAGVVEHCAGLVKLRAADLERQSPREQRAVAFEAMFVFIGREALDAGGLEQSACDEELCLRLEVRDGDEFVGCVKRKMHKEFTAHLWDALQRRFRHA